MIASHPLTSIRLILVLFGVSALLSKADDTHDSIQVYIEQYQISALEYADLSTKSNKGFDQTAAVKRFSSSSAQKFLNKIKPFYLIFFDGSVGVSPATSTSESKNPVVPSLPMLLNPVGLVFVQNLKTQGLKTLSCYSNPLIPFGEKMLYCIPLAN